MAACSVRRQRLLRPAPIRGALANTATATTTVNAAADLSITLTDTLDPVIAGSNLTYLATLTNNGPSDAQDANIALPLPAMTSFVSASASGGGMCTTPPVGANGSINCIWTGATAPGAGNARSVTVVALVSAASADGSVLSATATAASASTDPGPLANTATATTTVRTSADLLIGLTASATQVLVNVPVTFTATSLNQGPSDAQDVAITVTLTPDFRYTSHSASPGAVCTVPQVGTTGAVTCIWTGATAPIDTRTLQVDAYSNAEGASNVNASTTSATPDPMPDNNIDSLAVQIGYLVRGIPTLDALGLLLLGLTLCLVALRRID